MSETVTTEKPQTPKAPMTAAELVDLRNRVLRGEAVDDAELKHALSSLAMSRGTATGTSAAKAGTTSAYQPSGSLADRFKAFQTKPPATPEPKTE